MQVWQRRYRKHSHVVMIAIARYLIPLFFVAQTMFAAEAREFDESKDLPQWAKPSVEKTQDNSKKSSQASETNKTNDVMNSKHVRRFHEVLDELLAEFGYDVKQGQLEGLKDVAIRKVTTNEALPPSYSSYIELLLTERIRDNSHLRVISCVACKTKTSTIIDGKLLISSPTTNVAKLDEAAEQMGIHYFIDAMLLYHSSHMVLAMQAFDAKTKEQVWARTYNSETVKSRFQKLAIDYKQVEKARPNDEYQPEYKFLAGIGGAGIPNIAGNSSDSSMLDVQFRGMERFDNRKSEFGLLFSTYLVSSKLINKGATSEPSSTGIQPYSSAVGLYALFAHNFIGNIESYNEIRHGANLGVGGLVAASYLAGSFRGGWDLYFGRRFVASIAGVYVMPSKVVVDSKFVSTKGGGGGEFVISYNF